MLGNSAHISIPLATQGKRPPTWAVPQDAHSSVAFVRCPWANQGIWVRVVTPQGGCRAPDSQLKLPVSWMVCPHFREPRLQSVMVRKTPQAPETTQAPSLGTCSDWFMGFSLGRVLKFEPKRCCDNVEKKKEKVLHVTKRSFFVLCALRCFIWWSGIGVNS